MFTGLHRRYGWSELAAEVDEIRKLNLPGVVYFSATGLDSVWDNLGVKEFPYWSLVPTMPWKDTTVPPTPRNLTARWDDGSVRLTWEAPTTQEPLVFVVYRSETGSINVHDVKQILVVTGRDITQYADPLPPSHQLVYAVTAVGRSGNESPRSGSVAVHPPALAHR